MRRPPQSRKADGAHVDTVSIFALCQYVDISAQANEAPSARGYVLEKREGVNRLTFWRRSGKAGI